MSAKSVLTEFNLDLLYIRLKNYIYLYNVMPLYAVTAMALLKL